LLSLILLFIGRSGFAQDQYYMKGDTVIQIYRLQEVVVYGNREQIPSSMLIEIDQPQMRVKNSTTVAELLNLEPGLNLTTGYKSETETRIRGFRSSDVLVLIDGRPINPGYYGKVDLSMLPLDNLAKITIVKGPASVAYGANSMGGVINIVTQNGLETLRTVIETKLGDYQFRNLNLNHSRQIGRFNYWISGYEHHARGFRMSDEFDPTKYENGGLRELSFYHKAGISGKLGYQFNPNLLVTLASDYHWAKKDIPVATRFAPGDTPRYWRFPNWERYSATLSGEWKTNSRLALKSVLFADAYNDRLINYLNADMDDDQIDYDSLLKNFTMGGLVHGEYQLSQQHHLLAGVQFRQDQMEKKADLDEPWEDHFSLTGSLFLQDDFQPWKNTTLTLGVGYHFHQTETENTSGRFAPMVSFQQQLPGEWKLFSSYSHTVRFPVLHQLYSQTSGNPELQPEYADKLELGINKILFFSNLDQYCSVDLALFYNKMSDMIYRATRSLRYINISQATMQGVEVRTNWSLNKYLAGELSYSFIDFPQSVLEINDYLPANKLRLMLTGKTGFGTTLNYEAAYLDERQFYYTSNYVIALPDYFVHNVNLVQEVTKNITARLEVSNLLDEFYEEEFGYPQPGRQIMGGIRLSF
jgi:outer membrane cobalamin receptor